MCMLVQYWHFFLRLLCFRWHVAFELQDLENKYLIFKPSSCYVYAYTDCVYIYICEDMYDHTHNVGQAEANISFMGFFMLQWLFLLPKVILDL